MYEDDPEIHERIMRADDLADEINFDDMPDEDVCPGCACEECCCPINDFDECMDGDHESGLASAGFGTNEDYGDYGDGYFDEGDW